MAANFLNHPQGDASIAHLGEGGAAEAVGGCALDANALESFSQNPIRRV